MQQAGAATAVASALRDVVQGAVLTAADEEYDARRIGYLSGFDRRPAAIVRPADASDVMRTVDVARWLGTPLAVRSGGHSVAGHSCVEDGVLLDLSSLRGMEVDVADRTAWAEAGLTAGEYTRRAGDVGLATGFGDSATVGIGGITLAGGLGFLHRRHGMTIDNLLGAELVTAAGELLHVDADSHPDLFWALRGGGGNFGVVTRFRYRLLPVERVVAGLLILPATPATIAAFLEASVAAPEGLSGMISVTVAPPMPMLPASVHGQAIIMSIVAFDGTEADAGRALAPLRAAAPALVDTVASVRYPELFGGPAPPHPARMGLHTMFIDEFTEEDAAAILDAVQSGPGQMRIANFRVLGGAVSRVDPDATAFAHRRRRLMATFAAAAYDPAVSQPELDAWARQTGALPGWPAPGAYIGFIGDEASYRVRDAYPPGTLERLQRIKRAYDPDNLFRINHNVTPAGVT